MNNSVKLLVVLSLFVVLALSWSVSKSSANPSSPTITSIQAGKWHTCALTSTGGVKCWGGNGSGQLGNGNTISTAYPTDVTGLTSGVISLTTGGDHTCAVVVGGAVKCWGNNNNYQMGDVTPGKRLIPYDVQGLSAGVVSVVAGENHTCALLSNGGVKCWGDNFYRQLGCGSYCTLGYVSSVQGLSSGVKSLAAGSRHNCALMQDGNVNCWGSNGNGQLGTGNLIDSTIPVNVGYISSIGGATSVAAGDAHTCIAAVIGGVWCWGYNTYGQVGNNGFSNSVTQPTVVANLSGTVTSLSAGWYHTCAMSVTGMVCWGYNGSGQLGDNTGNDKNTPIPVLNMIGGASVLDGGYLHTCAVATSGVTRCWGRNSDGQAGNGTNTINIYNPSDVVWTVPSLSISGYIKDQGGLGVLGVTVSDGAGHSSQTLSNGVYTLSGLAPGNYTLTPSKSGYSFNPTSIPLTLSNADVTGQNFTASLTTYSISGTVIITGADPSGVTISGGTGYTTTTNNIGNFTLSGFPPGVYSITPSKTGYSFNPISRAINIVNGNMMGVNFAGSQTTTYTASGRITLNGAGLSEVSVANGSGLITTTAIDGSYSFLSLLSGTYTLTPSIAGYTFSPPTRQVTLPPNATNLDFTATLNTFVDLSIESVIPVQVLEGQPLVSGKATAVKVTIRKTGNGIANDVLVRLNYQTINLTNFHVAEWTNSDDQNKLKDDNVTHPLNFASPTDETKTIYFFSNSLAPSGNSFQVSATVDYLGLVTETDETNNTRTSDLISVFDTKWSGLLFPDLYVHYFRTDWGQQ